MSWVPWWLWVFWVLAAFYWIFWLIPMLVALFGKAVQFWWRQSPHVKEKKLT